MNPEKRKRRAKIKAKENRVNKRVGDLFYYKDGQAKYELTEKGRRLITS
jgi:hypothetical protein